MIRIVGLVVKLVASVEFLSLKIDLTVDEQNIGCLFFVPSLRFSRTLLKGLRVVCAMRCKCRLLYLALVFAVYGSTYGLRMTGHDFHRVQVLRAINRPKIEGNEETGPVVGSAALNVVAMLWGTQHVVIKSIIASSAYQSASVLNFWRFLSSTALYARNLALVKVSQVDRCSIVALCIVHYCKMVFNNRI
jgi:hypothetical protein